MDQLDTVTCYTIDNKPVTVSRANLSFRPGVYGIAFTEDRGQVLLTRAHGHNRWELPGGGVDLGESSRDAMVREIREEVGLTATVGESIFFGEHFYTPDSVHGWQAFKLYFLVHTSGTLDAEYAENIDAGGLNYGAAWVPVDELDTLAIIDLDYDAIQRALQWLEISEGPSLASADDDDE